MADGKTLVFRITGKDEVSQAFASVQRSLTRLGESVNGALGPLRGLQGALAAIGAAAGAGALVQTIASYEKLGAQLKTVTGSADAADKAFTGLEEFAATTPFQLDEVVTAFTKLRARGLDPSKEALTSYGNTAAAMGKSLDGMIEAVADAATGEFERLKEFNIAAQAQGDQVALTFNGVTTTVGKNAKEIEKYIQGIGQNNFGSAMADQMKTLNGVWSNIMDNLKSFAVKIGEGGLRQALSEVGQKVAELSKGGGTLARQIGSVLGAAVTTAANAAAFLARNFNLVLAAASAFAATRILAFLPAFGSAILQVVSAMRMLTIAMLANPLTLIPTLITAAVAAFVYFRDEVISVGDQTTTVWGATVAALQVAWDAIATGVTWLVDIIKAAWDAANGKVNEVFGADLITLVGGALSKIGGGFVSLTNTVIASWMTVGSTMRLVAEGGFRAFQSMTSSLGQVFSGLGSAVTSALTGEFDAAGDAIKKAMDVTFTTGIGDTFAGIKKQAEANFSTDWVGGLISGMTNGVAGTVDSLLGQVAEKVKENNAQTVESSKNAANQVRGHFGAAANATAQTAQAAAGQQQNAMQAVGAQAGQTGQQIADQIGDGYQDAGDASKASADRQINNLNAVANAARSTALAVGEAVAGGGKAEVTRYDSNGKVAEIRKPDGVLTSFRSEIEKFGFPAAATGGLLTGPGTGTSDSILMWGSNGEYMQSAKAVRHYGVGFMDAINNLRLPKFSLGGLVTSVSDTLNSFAPPSLPAFATGGLVEDVAGSVSYGGMTIHVGQVIASDPDEFIRKLNRAARSGGLRERLDPSAIGQRGKS